MAVCEIFETVINRRASIKYKLNRCGLSYTAFINEYFKEDDCDGTGEPYLCEQSIEKTCDNIEVIDNCCNLFAFPNGMYPKGLDKICIYPDGTIIGAKMISPNNIDQCQE